MSHEQAQRIKAEIIERLWEELARIADELDRLKNWRPVYECEVVKPRLRHDAPAWRFFCPHCRTHHTHGNSAGHRVAHCANSAHHPHGYYIVERPRGH